MSEKNEVETKTKPLKKKDTNLNEYSKSQLIEMVNTTSTGNFDGKYPEATFTRSQAWAELVSKYHLYHMNGCILPVPMSGTDLYSLVEKHCGSAADKKDSKKDVHTGAKRKISCNITCESHKKSFTIFTETYKKWTDFIKKYNIKKQYIQAYLSMAIELFIDMYENDEIEMDTKM